MKWFWSQEGEPVRWLLWILASILMGWWGDWLFRTPRLHYKGVVLRFKRK